MLNFLSQPSHETPTPAEGGTEEKRDAIVRHLIEREGFNAYRFADRLAGMPFDAYWQFSEEEAKQLPPVIPYNPAQRLYIEQLWSKQFPDSGFSTLDLAVQAIAIDLHEAREDRRITGRMSGEGDDWVQCYRVTDLAFPWIAKYLPALTILQALDDERYRTANLNAAQVAAIANHALGSPAGDREEWVSAWWQFNMRFYARLFLQAVEAAVKEKLSGDAATGGGEPQDLTP